MRRAAILAVLGALATILARPAGADIERKAVLECEKQQICFYIWPALPDLPGWHGEEESSFQLDANLRIPDGHTFDDTDVILAGNAVPQQGYRTDHPGTAALDGFILDDKARTSKDNPDAVITEQEALPTADGRTLRTFSITKLQGGHSQLVAYTEDGDKDGKFFVILMLDSGNESSFNANIPAFRQMVAKYQHFRA